MFRVANLDNRHHSVSTCSEKLAREAWAGIIEAEGTPIATLNGRRVDLSKPLPLAVR